MNQKAQARQQRAAKLAKLPLTPDPLLAGLNHELACLVPHPARVHASGTMVALAEAVGPEPWSSFIALATDTNTEIHDIAKSLASHPRYRLLVEDEQDPGALACLAAVWLAFCQRGPQVIVTRDALDWILVHSDLDASLRAESFAMREQGCYLQLGEYPGMDPEVNQQFLVPGKGVIEGLYLFSSTRERSRLVEVVVVVRSDVPGLSSNMLFTSATIHDEGKPLRDVLEPLVTMQGPRGTPFELPVIEHLAKVLLYAATGNQAEKEYLPPHPTIEDMQPSLLNRPYPLVLLGPASLSRLRLDIEAPATGVAAWCRGRFSRFMDRGVAQLRWQPPRLENA